MKRAWLKKNNLDLDIELAMAAPAPWIHNFLFPGHVHIEKASKPYAEAFGREEEKGLSDEEIINPEMEF
jgi:hypothetical protein